MRHHIPPSDSFVHRHILGPEAVVPAKVLRVPLTEVILELVRANLGISILARWAVAPQLASGELVAIPLDTSGAPAGAPHDASAVFPRAVILTNGAIGMKVILGVVDVLFHDTDFAKLAVSKR